MRPAHHTCSVDGRAGWRPLSVIVPAWPRRPVTDPATVPPRHAVRGAHPIKKMRPPAGPCRWRSQRRYAVRGRGEKFFAPTQDRRVSARGRRAVPTNNQCKEGAYRALYGSGRRAGRCRPSVRRAVRGGQGWSVGGRHWSRAGRWGAEHTGAVVSGALSFLPGIRKKNRNFSYFFCDPGLLSDCSADRSAVAAERPVAAPSP